MFLKDIYADMGAFVGKKVTLSGWIRNHRKQKNMGFIDFFDGTCFKSIQLVYDENTPNFDEIQAFHIGSAVKAEGELRKTEYSKDGIEFAISSLEHTSIAWESVPCSAWESRSEATNEGTAVSSATTITSEGPAGISIAVHSEDTICLAFMT